MGTLEVPALNFWYELASSYSYPAAMRIASVAAAAGVEVRWRPFLLGAIFKAQGWPDSPFNLHPAKGRYMRRDLERICAQLGLAFRLPDPFPQANLMAARVALIAHDEGWAKTSRSASSTPSSPRAATSASARRWPLFWRR